VGQTLPGMGAGRPRCSLRRDEPRHRALHQVDVKAAGLEQYGKPGNYFERQIGRWSKQYIASITDPIPRWTA
jgi:hypothetical protein